VLCLVFTPFDIYSAYSSQQTALATIYIDNKMVTFPNS
jgi:hypothetical protein